MCKMAFLAPRTGHISSYSCPFDLVPSRIDSPECPLQNRVLWFQYFFLTQNPPKWPVFALKRPKKKTPKWVKNAPKRPEIQFKKMPKWSQKWCRNDAKMIPKWPHVTPIDPKKWSKITLFWSQDGPKRTLWPQIGSKWLKGVKKVQKWPTTVQKSSRPSSSRIKTLKIHSGYFQTHPLTAHFHRLKRRCWPFF